jgi:hypothetical protein
MTKIKFEDLLKEFDEMIRQSEDYAKGFEAGVEMYVAKILLERYPTPPNGDPNITTEEFVSESEKADILREAVARTEALMKSKIEQGAREAYNRIVGAPEPPTTKQ